MYVDSDPSSRELMSRHFEELGIAKRLILLEDGEQVLKYFMMRSRKEELKGDHKMKQIACLLILEINVKGTIGNEVLSQIKSFFEPTPHLVRPLACYLSRT